MAFSLLLNVFPLCHLSFFLSLYFFFFLPKLGSLSPCVVIFSLLPLLLQVFFLSPWRIPLCHCTLLFSIALSLLLLLFPLYWTFFLYVVAFSPSTIIFSPLPLFSFYAIDLSLSMPFPLLPSFFPLCHHSLLLGFFSPLCHSSLPLDFLFLMCLHFLPSTIVLFLFLWLFPFCNHAFPSAITFSPLQSLLPFRLFLSFVSSYSPLYHCYLSTIVLFFSIVLSLLPLCMHIYHRYLPFVIVFSPLPSQLVAN